MSSERDELLRELKRACDALDIAEKSIVLAYTNLDDVIKRLEADPHEADTIIKAVGDKWPSP